MYSRTLPIFDSLTHPTFSGEWLGKSKFSSSSFEELVINMSKSNVRSAIASTFPTNEIINPDLFSLECRKLSDSTGLYINPAYIVYNDSVFLESDLPTIKYSNQKNNFTPIIKLNSCFTNFQNLDAIKSLLAHISDQLNAQFVLYVCTYPYSTLSFPEIVEIRPLLDFLSLNYFSVPIILLHGGAVNILEISQYAQHFKNIYLDLSFTICRYINSSLFYDFCYLLEYLDQKIVIGTDHPEYTYLDLRDSICKIENHVVSQTNMKNESIKCKLSNIMYKNMSKLISHG